MARALVCLLVSGFMMTVAAGGCGDDGEGPAPVTGLAIAEDSLSVGISEALSISATVSGGGTKAVAWYVNGILGGNGTLGTITQINPATLISPDTIPDPATVVVKAVSQEDTGKIDSCMVTIVFVKIYVNGAGGSDETGTGGVMKPFKSIAKGLDAAHAGMFVEVAEGTYEEHDVKMKSGVTLRSETGEASCVTVDAKGLGRVFECEYTDTTTGIVGFTITGGNPIGEGYEDCGGGVRCKDGTEAHVTLVNCVFSDNNSGGGGGLACMQSCSARLTNCVFSGNSAQGYGGAIYYINDSDASFTDCTFFGNFATSKGGAIMCAGDCEVGFVGCTFCGNSAAQSGGGIHVGMGTRAILENTIMAFSPDGEAIYIQEEAGSVALSCCDLYGNEGGDWTGALAAQVDVGGNFCGDPFFCDKVTGDLKLQACSPCLPGNHPVGDDCGLIGAWGQGCPCE